MSGPSFARPSGSLRTYSRKSSEKPAEAVRENSPTLSQILNQDNSMLMSFDTESLTTLDHDRSKQETTIEPKERKKRKSQEEAKDQQKPTSTTFDAFKAPLSPKRLKISNEIAAPINIITIPPAASAYEENLSQSFLKLIANDSYFLTQTTDALKETIASDDGSFSFISNPITCSQYLQVKRPEEEEKEKAAEELSNSLEELFNNASHEDSLVIEALNNVMEQEEAGSISLSKPSAQGSPNTTSVNGIQQKNLNIPKRPKLLPVSSETFRELGPFFGLTNFHKSTIFETKNIPSLYDWQEECLNLRAIHDRTNLIYALPTSGGKTLVAEIAMFREILLRKRNVIFVLPYVSIVQEKVQDLMPFAMKFGFTIEEYCAGKGSIPPMKRRNKNVIFICTIEKGQILYDSLCAAKRLNEIGLIVVDELHMVGDQHRGYNLEMLLSKAIFNKQGQIQVIGMSATISNLRDIAKFLRADIYTRDFRPVELKESVKIGSEIFSIDSTAKDLSQAFKPERSLSKVYTPQLLKKDPDHLGALLLEISPKESSLVFCATKQNCESVALLLCDLFPKDFRRHKREEKQNLIESIKLDGNGQICKILEKTLPFGIAYHHSGLTSDERKHLEEAYRLNIICIICCTSTLAAGVNLPAKRVIIRSPYIGKDFLTLTRYKQMVGRAGRAGKCETGESIMICDEKDHQKLTSLLCSKMDETVSGFVQDDSGILLQTVVMNLIGVQIAKTIDDLISFFECTLLSVQIHLTTSTMRQVVVKSVQKLTEKGALTSTLTSDGSRYASFAVEVDGKRKDVYPDDILAVSQIGKAAVNAGLSHEEARRIEADMRKSYKHLVLVKDLHLFFIIAPDDIVDSIYPQNNLMHNTFMNLENDLSLTMEAVGISVTLVMRLVSRPGSIKPNEMLRMKKFFVALMLLDLWNGKDVHEVGHKFKVNRGIAFSLMNSASSRAYTLFKFCEMCDEFWVFQGFLENFSKRLAYCCSAELLPLMELPAVKIGRAKQIYAAGFKSIADVAALEPDDLVQSVKNVNKRQAEQIIKAAKYALREKIDIYQEQLEEMKDVIKPYRKKANKNRTLTS